MILLLHGYPTMAELWPIIAIVLLVAAAVISAATYGIVKLVKYIKSKFKINE